MKTITIQDIKTKGSKAISDTEPTFLIVHSKIKTVMLPIREYEQMVELIEDYEDLRTVKERENEETMPIEEMYKKLGIRVTKPK